MFNLLAICYTADIRFIPQLQLQKAGGKAIVGMRFLVTLDTDHIKRFVFETDKLKEIRGASSILDNLNRKVMVQVAKKFQAETIFTNGGAGLFVINDGEKAAREFCQVIQQEFQKRTSGGASITFAIQEIPESIPNFKSNPDLHPYLRLLQARLQLAKGYPHQNFVALPSQPLIRLCDACGIRYAEDQYEGESADPDDQRRRYCKACLNKRTEDYHAKQEIKRIVEEKVHTGRVKHREGTFIWETIIDQLPTAYNLQIGTDRPSDFNKFQGLSSGKDYLGLVYADANNMGMVMDELDTLEKREAVAKLVDAAVYRAMSTAIAKHLPVVKGDEESPFLFPFDILMIGGDDVMVVTPADVALDVALTLAKEFHAETKKHDIRQVKDGYTLSVGVVLAPVKYPFGLLQDLAETTLKAAKKEDTKRRRDSFYGTTFINFMTVTGSTSLGFNKVYKSLHDNHVKDDEREVSMYGTLRPYTVEELDTLLGMIREGRSKGLGRTKLHQVRAAVLKMNLTTSVYEGMAVLRNWQAKQREFIMQHVYKLGNQYQEPYHDTNNPGSLFPRITFPWFADGPETYRTALLDFVELYDFVGQGKEEEV